MADLPKDVVLPAGWSSDLRDSERHIVIQSPYGYITLSLVDGQRGYRYGLCTIGKLNSTKEYKGRGWLTQLAKDAIEWLKWAEEQGRGPKI